MHIRFPEFKTTLFYDLSKFNGDHDRVVYDLLLETLCRLPVTNLNTLEKSKLQTIIEHNYLEYKKVA